MTRIIGVAAATTIATAYFLLSALPTFGDSVGTVAARVSVAAPAAPCLVVGPESGLDFGTLAFPTSPSSSQGAAAPQQTTLTNCGTADETVYARGIDAESVTSKGAWTLTDTSIWEQSGFNLYGLSITASGRSSNVALSKTNALWGAVAPGATDSITTTIQMPRAGSDHAGETMTMRIIYTAGL
jgi:hypothetical protein